MSQEKFDGDIASIAEKFTNHLESLVRMVDYSELIEKEYKTKKAENKSLGELADLIIQVKSAKKVREVNGEIDEEQMEENNKIIELVDSMINESDIIRYFDSHLDVLIDDDLEISSIKTTSQFVNNVIDNNLSESYKMDSDINQLLNSIIISLVTGMELLIADLFKDFVQNVDQSDLIKNKQLTYSDLVKVGDIEEARMLLVDGYIEELLKLSFKSWLDEIEKKMNFKIKTNSFVVNDIEKIFEVFQRRHLLIHNNGVVNSLYLTKVHPKLTENLEKNDSLVANEQYISDSIAMFRRFGLVLVYLYAEKKYKTNIDLTFETLNDLLISPELNTCTGTRYIFKEISKNQKYSHQSKLFAEINYYLTFKLSDNFEEIRPTVEKFDVSTLSIEYKMAKNILLDNYEDALEEFKLFCSALSDDAFVSIIEWPLIKVARNSDSFVEYINNKINSIITNEEEEESEI